MPESFSNGMPIPSAPCAIINDDFDQIYYPDNQQGRRQQEESDEAFARMLQAQENAAIQGDVNHELFPTVASPPDTPPFARQEGFIASPTATEMEDERLARALEQEMRDEELARALQQREEGRLRRSSSVPLANGPPISSTASTSRCSARRIVSGGFFLVILGTAAVLLVVFGSSIWSRLGGDPNDMPPFFRNDGGTGDENSSSTGQFSQWRNKKQGLTLTIRNSLSSDWDTYFVKAVNDWNMAPALQLSMQDAAEDPDCSSVRGILKVCNGFYGRTGWTGLNEIYFEGSNIAASVAKMNESYLSASGTRTSERQYVMCHEIGHGFGLPHRDESPNNPDLGSCLDYTFRFENNMEPDSVVDFDNLKNLYGVIGNRRALHEKEYDKVIFDETILTKRDWSHETGRMLHQSEHHQVYENDLGGGLRVVTTLLLAKDTRLKDV
mmetsp:Transcript_6050/g.11469  ORF Transcript_6050/g.11469 Transcript_6050/m.11469 type:complete len:440 (-) Transcript_6050:2372-3691(-)